MGTVNTTYSGGVLIGLVTKSILGSIGTRAEAGIAVLGNLYEKI